MKHTLPESACVLLRADLVRKITFKTFKIQTMLFGLGVGWIDTCIFRLERNSVINSQIF